MNFRIVNGLLGHLGFQMTFANECNISVMWGERTLSDQGKTTAEVAAWNGSGDWMMWNGDNWVVLTDDSTYIMTNQTTDDVAMLISELVKLK